MSSVGGLHFKSPKKTAAGRRFLIMSKSIEMPGSWQTIQ